MKALAMRLPGPVRFLALASALMLASYGVFHVRAVSLAAPTGLETARTDRADYDAGDTVFVRGTGFEPTGAVRVRVVRPDGSEDFEAASIDDSGRLALSYRSETVTGRYALEILGRDNVRLALVTFR